MQTGAAILVAATLLASAAGISEWLLFPALWALGLGWNFGLLGGSALLIESVASAERVGVQGTADLTMSLCGAVAGFASGFIRRAVGYHVLADVAAAAPSGCSSPPTCRRVVPPPRTARGLPSRGLPAPGWIEKRPRRAKVDKPNILVIWGDDIGITNLSCYSDGLMGYRTPNIDRIADEGMRFTDAYGEQSCTAGRSSFITGQSVFRTGLSKVGMPGAPIGLQAEDPTIAELLKPLGYATGQFGKNHLGDRNEFLPTVHGFDEFFGNLYHLNAEEEPELPDYPRPTDFPNFRKRSGRAACCTAGRPTRTTPPSIRAGGGSASSASRTPVR